MIGALGVEVLAVKINDTTITLQSQKYYGRYDLTRLKYRVKTDKNKEWPTYWILEAGACITEEMIDVAASSPFTWVDEPFRGFRFEVTARSRRFTLWLEGRWDVGAVDTALSYEGGGQATGEIDGPYCAGSSISVEIVRGGTVGFPPVLAVGRFDGDTDTTLRVTSTSAGWSLDRSLDLSLPPGAREDVVLRVFEVTVTPHGAGSGSTEFGVSYALTITEEDLNGLPEGTYVIGVSYTVSADN